MKKLIFTQVLMLCCFSLLFLSCNKEDGNKSTTGNAKADTFLKSFYHKNVRIGKAVESRTLKSVASATAKSVEYEDIKLAEVFVGDEERARGYVVTDKNSEEFLYFADVDRQDYKLTTFDAERNETLIKENINQLQEWATSNKLDLVQLLEEYQAQVASGNFVAVQKFWGWTGWRNVGGCDSGWQTQVNTHYSCFVKDAYEYNEVPCSN